MAQVQVRDVLCQVFRINQSGTIIPAGVPGNGAGCADRGFHGVHGKIRCRGGTLAPIHVDRDSQTFIALVLYGLDPAHTYADRQAVAHVDIRFRCISSQLATA